MFATLALLIACRKSEPTDDGSTRAHSGTTPVLHTGRGTPPDHTGATGSTGDTAPPQHTALEEFDCSTVSPTPLGVRSVPAARGYHGLAFDFDGYVYGSDNNFNVIQADAYGNGSLFAPGQTTQGFETLSTGEIALTLGNGVRIVDPITLGSRVVGSNVFGPYGLVEGPDGMLYTGNRSDTYRIDPATGDATMYIPGNEAQSVGFSPDGSKFYYTKTFGPALWEVDLDSAYNPVAPPRQLSTFGGGYRDGLAVDICGNIYVPDYSTTRLYRTDPAGNTTVYVNFGSLANYGHSAVFGSGINGWLSDALYVPQPYNNHTVGEIQTGVPGFGFPL